MKNRLTKYSENTFIYLIVLVSWIYVFFNLPFGFKTYVDEAFFVLGLDPQQTLGIQHTQFFPIARFIFRIFHLAPTVLNSRIVALVCMIITFLSFSAASYYWLKKKEITQSFYLYLSLVALWGLPVFFSSYEISFSFNHILVFSLTALFSCYLLWDATEKRIVQGIWIFAAGCFSLLAILNYFPASILVSLILLFLFVLQAESWKSALLNLLWYLVGIAVFALIYNCLIHSLADAFLNIIHSIKSPAFGTGGYDMHSYIILLWVYAKTFALIALSSIGIYFLYTFAQKQTYIDKWTANAILFIAMLVLILLEASDVYYNLLLIPVVTAALFYYTSHPIATINRKNKQQIISIIQKAFFFFFPVIALQGTNVDMIYKLLYFGFSWIFLLAGYLFRIKNQSFFYKSVLYLTVALALYFGFFRYFMHYAAVRGTVFNVSHKIEQNEKFNHIYLQQRQINYFQEVDSLLQSHQFNPQKDRILAFDYDYATLLYLNVPNYGGLMHHIDNMPNYKAVFYSQANAPDYILVAGYDRRRLKRMADWLKWDFPQAYTEYKTGNPDGEINNPAFRGRSVFVKNK